MEEIFQKIINSKSKTFLAFCFSFFIGILLFSFQNNQVAWYPLVVSFVTLSILALLFFKNQRARIILLCLVCVSIGLLRFNLAFPASESNNIYFYNAQKVELTGFVSDDPDIRQDGVRYRVSVQSVGDMNAKKDVTGNIYFSAPLYPRYAYGQVLHIGCNLQIPKPTEDFHYEKYLATKKVFSLCQTPQIQATQNFVGNSALQAIFSLKEKVAEKINSLWHEPYASFVAGILYGYRGGLGALQEDFNRTGLTHIVAVSGFNISIIATYLGIIFLWCSVPRKKSFYLIAFLIVAFVLFTGGSASAVRAGIMGLLVLFAKQIGRSSRIFNVLILCAVLMVLHNPFILMWDAGFQLSYLSTIGLIYFSPILERKWHNIPTKFSFKEMYITTLSAMILTMPLILYQFGRFSTVALFANLLVLPIIPYIMGLGFLALLGGFVFLPLGEGVTAATYVGMRYVTFVVEHLSKLSFASLELSIPLWLMLALYLGIFYFMFSQKKIKA